MDRTVIGPWKAEERDLSEKLYKKLYGLTLLYPPTEDFRKCFTEDMFLKPNQQAFFNVMHYLFKLHDPVEFRKRFYWPVTDKKAEANFRSSTIDYLKYLDERHQLHWTNIKSYLVQMPGGMKFIIFLLDLVSFVVLEQIKYREKHLSCDTDTSDQVSDLNMKRMRKQNEFFKEYASAYISDADRQIDKLKAKTLLIQNDFREISTAISQNVTLLIDDEFGKEFEANNCEFFRQKFMVPVASIASLEPSFAALKEAIDSFQNKKSKFQIDKDSLRRAIIKIQQLYPERLHIADEEFQATPYDDSIKIDSLIKAFNVIHESIEEHLTAANKKPRSSNFVIEQLNALKTELQQIEAQITAFQKKLNSEMKKRTCMIEMQEKTPMRITIGSDLSNANSKQHNKENTLLMKFVATPPIKLEMLEGSRKTNTRLPLLDDFALNVERSMAASAKAGMDSLNNLLALPRSARKTKNANVSIDLNNTVNKSKIIDPMQLLRTINKDTIKALKLSTQNDRSTLDFKWKERQCLFGKDIGNSPGPVLHEDNIDQGSEIISTTEHIQPKAANTTTVSSPFTPFNCNDRTRITRTQLHDTSGGGGGGSLLYAKKLSAVKKVQDASLNFHNLSTSPSGRLDPLVTMEEKDLPKLLLNDITIGECISPNDINLNASTTVYPSSSIKSPTIKQTDITEKTANISNTEIKFVFDMEQQGDVDEIFNISDTVLKDVIM